MVFKVFRKAQLSCLSSEMPPMVLPTIGPVIFPNRSLARLPLINQWENQTETLCLDTLRTGRVSAFIPFVPGYLPSTVLWLILVKMWQNLANILVCCGKNDVCNP